MKKIVVIGGGIAGITLIRELEKSNNDLDIILIEPKEYLEVTYGMLRALVDPTGFGAKVRRVITEIIKAKHILAKAIELKAYSVVLDNNDEIKFDYCVIATGAAIQGFSQLKVRYQQSKEDRDKQWLEEGSLLRNSTDIAIIGGGVVGVELAGEIKETFRDKNLTLYNRGERLMEALPKGAGTKAYKVLKKLGVKIELNNSAHIENKTKDKIVVKSQDLSYKYDIVYETFGNRFDSELLKPAFSNYINDRNQIIVNEYLQLDGFKQIWVIGDINNLVEMKLGALATKQAKRTAFNILRTIENKPIKKYKPFKGALSLVTLGKNSGIGQLPFGRLDFLAAYKQKKNLFVDETLDN